MSVQVEVDTRAALAMLRTKPQEIDRALESGIRDGTIYLQRELSTYPPQRPGSTYVRQNTLKSSWQQADSLRVQKRGSVIEGRIASNSNIAPYNRYVQDAEHQASIHRRRWTNTVQNVARRSRRQIHQFIQDRINAALR